MSQQTRRSAATAWGALLALALALGACGGTGVTHAQTTAAALPPPSATPTVNTTGQPTPGSAAVPGSSNPAPAGATTIGPGPSSAVAPASGPVPTTAHPVAATPTTARAAAPAIAANKPAAPSPTAPVTSPPTTASRPALAARRQPTAAEVNQVIATVQGLLPVYTPSAAQIATVGNLVCTAFDQGQSFAQVKAGFLTMVGAGGYSSLVPASVPDTAVRTLVPMYCPGYGPKLV